MYCFLQIISVLFFINHLYSQENSDSTSNSPDTVSHEDEKADSLVSSDIGFIGYPYVFYSPETELAFGVGALFFFRTAPFRYIKPSKILLSFYYTTNKQYNLVLNPEIYFANIKEFYLNVKLNFGNRIGRFYDIGNQTSDIGTTSQYLMQQFWILAEMSASLKFLDNIPLGLIYDFSRNTMKDKKENPYFLNEDVPGEDGGSVGGAGLSVRLDNRDNIFFPSKGFYIKVQTIFYDRPFGSDFSFNKLTADYRQYLDLVESHILAWQIYSELCNGIPPFYRLPALGGANRMRGYFEGRYRDRQYLATQIEYRKIVWWRLGLAAFFAFGDVADKVSMFRLDQVKHSYGFGLRFVFDETEKINLRADIGIAQKDTGIYFAIEEAF